MSKVVPFPARPFSQLGFVIVLAVFLFSSYSLYYESSVYLYGNSTPERRLAASADGDIAAGMSTSSKAIALRDCDDALKSEYSRGQDVQVRTSAMQHCLEFALEVTASDPANGLAWFIAAQASAWLGEYTAMGEYLSKCQAVAANRATLAAGRLSVLFSVPDHWSDEMKTILRADIAALSTSLYGLQKLSDLYVRSPSLRPILTSNIETLSPQAQRRFLAVLKKRST